MIACGELIADTTVQDFIDGSSQNPPGTGLVVMCAYALVALGIATVMVQRRDTWPLGETRQGPSLGRARFPSCVSGPAQRVTGR